MGLAGHRRSPPTAALSQEATYDRCLDGAQFCAKLADIGMGEQKLATYRNELPQLSGDFFLTDAGLETDLIFNHGIEIKEFAAHSSNPMHIRRFYAPTNRESESGIVRDARCPGWVCAVVRRRSSVGANPTPQLSLRPEATGAIMDATKWLKPSESVSRIGEPRLPLWVKTGSPAWASECPLLGVEQTSISSDWMSACSHKPTLWHVPVSGGFKAPNESHGDRWSRRDRRGGTG